MLFDYPPYKLDIFQEIFINQHYKLYFDKQSRQTLNICIRNIKKISIKYLRYASWDACKNGISATRYSSFSVR